MTRFLRNYELVIGVANTQGIQITDLQLQFEVERNTKESANSATFKIFNLSDDSRNKIHDLEKKDGVVQLKVGYGDSSLSNIFLGNIISVTSKLESPDIVTEVICGDGYVSIRDAKIEFSFPNKITLRDVVLKLISEAGLEQGVIKGESLEQEFNNGVTLSGRIFNLLTKYCHQAPVRLNWSIQNGRVDILPFGEGQSRALLIDAAAGLIGSPERTGKRPGAEKGAPEPESGASFTCLLNHEIEPNVVIELSSKFVNGQFICESVKHIGDYEGNSWITEVKGVSPLDKDQ